MCAVDQRPVRTSENPMKAAAMWLIRLYQKTISRALPPSCRFVPSCSEYTYQAIEKYGILKGGWLGLKRISRCHPLNPGGYDPVP
jgi:putative membrane protein insertion efficiency factor